MYTAFRGLLRTSILLVVAVAMSTGVPKAAADATAAFEEYVYRTHVLIKCKANPTETDLQAYGDGDQLREEAFVQALAELNRLAPQDGVSPNGPEFSVNGHKAEARLHALIAATIDRAERAVNNGACGPK
jgi:hypothetical protein